jgi:hypothetical protein
LALEFSNPRIKKIKVPFLLYTPLPVHVSKRAINGIHISLAKEDTFITNVYLAVLPVNAFPWFKFPLEGHYAT